jgi:D-aminoacyl-tRNA deacylase
LTALKLFVAKIVYSKKDAAGGNIARILKEKRGFSPRPLLKENGEEFLCWGNSFHSLIEINTPLLEADWLSRFPKTFSCELLVFASKHESEKKLPCLTAHATGNFGKPESAEGKNFGGTTSTLSKTSANALRAALDFLRGNPVPGFVVSREATHHGPTNLSWPSLFVEVGSSPTEWQDELACRAVADAVLASANHSLARKAAIGFGGPHYCPAFNEYEAENGEFAFSHICSKYSLESLNEALFNQMIEKTIEPVEFAFIDCKGTRKAYKDKICEWAERKNIEIEKI